MTSVDLSASYSVLYFEGIQGNKEFGIINTINNKEYAGIVGENEEELVLYFLI